MEQIKKSDVICRTRKKKRGYSIIDNIAIDDMNISIEALGVYNVFKRWSTLETEDFICSKTLIMSKSRCKEKKFERIWKELKEAGYIKMYFDGNTWTAELLEEPEPDEPHTYYLNAAGEIKRTVSKTAKTEEILSPPQKRGDVENDLHPPHLRGDSMSGDPTGGGLKRGNNINTFNNYSLNNYSVVNQSIHQNGQNPENTEKAPEVKPIDRLIDGKLIEEIKDQINYEVLMEKGIECEQLDAIVEIIAEMKIASEDQKIGDNSYNAEFLNSRAGGIKAEHIEYVFDCICQNKTKIQNIKNYLKVCLLNAPLTIDAFYQTLATSKETV